MSPEIWANRPYDSGCDLWALGCTLYELAALRPPFLGDSFPQLKKAVKLHTRARALFELLRKTSRRPALCRRGRWPFTCRGYRRTHNNAKHTHWLAGASFLFFLRPKKTRDDGLSCFPIRCVFPF
jgi:serine/threonine protein kinase